jgi:hypothetical protein
MTGYNFNNNSKSNQATLKSGIGGMTYLFTKRNQQKNNTYLLTISKGSNPAATATQSSIRNYEEETKGDRENLVYIMEELNIDSNQA